MFTKVSAINKFSGLGEEQLNSMSDSDVELFRINYPYMTNSTINQVIETFKENNRHSGIIDFLQKEIDWRERVRESILVTDFNDEISWGLIPSLSKKTNWIIKSNKIDMLGVYIANIMFWHVGVGLNGTWFAIIRPDSNTVDSGSIIKFRTDLNGVLEIKSKARDRLIFDKKTNSRNLTQLLKIIELIADKKEWLTLTSYNKM